MLKQALIDWEQAEYAQSWENISYCMLGSPHGQLSSLFINRETGLKMRKVWQAVCAAGVFSSFQIMYVLCLSVSQWSKYKVHWETNEFQILC